MTSNYTTEASAVADAMNSVYENKQVNKKDDISGDFSSDSASYPTVKAVKTALSGKLDNTHTSYKGKNVVTDANGVITFENKPTIPDVSGKIDTAGTGLSKSGTTLNHSNSVTAQTSAVFKKIKYDAQGHITSTTSVSAADLPTHTHSQYLTDHQSLSDIGGVVTVEEQSTAETGYAKTYLVKQNGSQVGSKINIPKDFLVKSGQVKTVSTANNPVSGYVVGDKYIDFVINSKDGSATDEHMYIKVSDLVEDTTYSADNSTLQLSSSTFSIKNKGVTATQIADNTITATQIASKTITASEIADSVVAKGITQTDINNWNAMVSGGLTTSDVQSEISAFATALANAINPQS